MRFLALFLALMPRFATAAPLTNAQTFAAYHVNTFRNGTPGMMMVKGTTDDNAYMLEADPVTGAIPVSATITFPYDTNWGTVGSETLRGAAEIGNASGAADFNLGTPGSQTLRTAAMMGVGSAAVSTTNPVPTVSTGKSYSDSTNYDYSGGSVTTASWTQLIASTAADISLLCLTDTSGQVMKIGVGAAASESIVFLLAQGFSGCIPLKIASGTRLSVRAVTATASTGYLTLSGMN